MLFQDEPYQSSLESESIEVIYNFCTLCTISSGTKFTLQKLFLTLLDDSQPHKEILLSYSNFNSEIELFKTLLNLDESLALSKNIIKAARNLKSKK